MRIISYGLFIIIALLSLTFACLNADLVAINYYIGQAKLPLSLLLALAFCSGAILGLIFSLTTWFKLKRENSRLTQRIKLAEKEISNLRVLPLKDSH